MRTSNITETVLMSSLNEKNDYSKEKYINSVFGIIVPSERLNFVGHITGRILQQDLTILNDSITRESSGNLLGKLV